MYVPQQTITRLHARRSLGRLCAESQVWSSRIPVCGVSHCRFLNRDLGEFTAQCLSLDKTYPQRMPPWWLCVAGKLVSWEATTVWVVSSVCRIRILSLSGLSGVWGRRADWTLSVPDKFVTILTLKNVAVASQHTPRLTAFHCTGARKDRVIVVFSSYSRWCLFQV